MPHKSYCVRCLHYHFGVMGAKHPIACTTPGETNRCKWKNEVGVIFRGGLISSRIFEVPVYSPLL